MATMEPTPPMYGAAAEMAELGAEALLPQTQPLPEETEATADSQAEVAAVPAPAHAKPQLKRRQAAPVGQAETA
jgi:hypothetical protein